MDYILITDSMGPDATVWRSYSFQMWRIRRKISAITQSISRSFKVTDFSTNFTWSLACDI